MKLKKFFLFFILNLIIFLAAGCGSQRVNPNQANSNLPDDQLEANQEEIDLVKIKPNELGRIMILMYHQISPKEGEWSRTPENFRRDLQRLYDNGYRLISLKDYLNNNIDVPAGFTPVILTFDDSPANQFKYIEENGELVIDPNCAVGIITEFAKSHPDFGTAATFYINFPASAFGQKGYTARKLVQLAEFNMDIGNHTYSHAYLNRIDSEAATKELALHVREVQKILPGYSVDSLALPFGLWPKDKSIAIAGEFEGTTYNHKAILLVGAHPAPSPVSNKFNPLALPRVRGSQEELDKWFKYFEQRPEDRYISDGDPDTITVREDLAEYANLNKNSLQGKVLRTYSLNLEE